MTSLVLASKDTQQGYEYKVDFFILQWQQITINILI
jgi:hypothetical protein